MNFKSVTRSNFERWLSSTGILNLRLNRIGGSFIAGSIGNHCEADEAKEYPSNGCGPYHEHVWPEERLSISMGAKRRPSISLHGIAKQTFSVKLRHIAKHLAALLGMTQFVYSNTA